MLIPALVARTGTQREISDGRTAANQVQKQNWKQTKTKEESNMSSTPSTTASYGREHASAAESTFPQRLGRLCEGAYDLQVHVAPDVIERRIDDIDLAKEFLSHGLRGFVLKSHYFPTGERARVVCRAAPGIAAYGAITLNHSVGGLNPVAVELAGRSGCKIVWMPTVDAANETAGRLDGPTTKLPFWAKIQRELAAAGIAPPPMTVLDAAGKISEPARRCIELIAKHNMILATGHLGRVEIFALVKAAREMGAKRAWYTSRRASFSEPFGGRTVRTRGNGRFHRTLLHHHVHRKSSLGQKCLRLSAEWGPSGALLVDGPGPNHQSPGGRKGSAMFAQRLLDDGFSVGQIRRMTVDNPHTLVQ